MSTATPPHRSLAHDLRGVSQLAIDATLGVVQLSEHLTANILNAPHPLGRVVHTPTGGIFGLVYRSIQGVTHGVGSTLDFVWRRIAPALPPVDASPQHDAVLAIANGVLGHHLAATGNPLATSMSLRYHGVPLSLADTAEIAAAVPEATGHLLICIHGLCMNDQQWTRAGHNHGLALAAAGYTPLYLRYNTGEHISSNGRAFAAQLEALVAHWPVPVRSITLLCHSMGGLVARSACHYGMSSEQVWPGYLTKMIFLGTPHHGSPLERGGNLLDRALGTSPYTAAFSRLGKIRSAGITDLRHGYVRDDDWANDDRFAHRGAPAHAVPLPDGVECYAIAATLAEPGAEQPGRLHAQLGDGLVPLHSALGRHKNPARHLNIPRDRQWVARGTSHFDLLSSRAVHARIADWLALPKDDRAHTTDTSARRQTKRSPKTLSA